MKQLLIMISLSISFSSNCQEKKQSRFLKVAEIKEHEYCYLITGVDTVRADTLFFISLKESLNKNSDFQKIEFGNNYLFEIEDMDNIKGHLPAALPNGYYIKIGNRRFKRDGRNGNTLTTTQFISKNTSGLWIKKIE